MASVRISSRAVASTAIALYALGWALPVVRTSTLFSPSSSGALYYGWDAIRFSLTPVLQPARPSSLPDALLQLSGVASGFTNLIFVLLAGSMILRVDRVPSVRHVIGGWGCATLNLMWIGIFKHELRVGYFCWLASYFVLVLAQHERRRAASHSTLAALTAAT